MLARKYLANAHLVFMVAFAFQECHALFIELPKGRCFPYTLILCFRVISYFGYLNLCLVSSKTKYVISQVTLIHIQHP